MCSWRLTVGIMSSTALFRALCVKGGTHPPFLIGNLPRACCLASLLVLLPNAACTWRCLSPVCTQSGALVWAAGACMDDVRCPLGGHLHGWRAWPRRASTRHLTSQQQPAHMAVVHSRRRWSCVLGMSSVFRSLTIPESVPCRAGGPAYENVFRIYKNVLKPCF